MTCIIEPISEELQNNYTFILEAVHSSDDLKKRDFNFKGKQGICLFIETLIDIDKLEKMFLSNIQKEINDLKECISASEIKVIQQLNGILRELQKGAVAIFLEGEREAYVFNVKSTLDRAVEEPANEKIVRGSHDGFVETLMTNLHILRSRIQNRDMVIKYHTVGTETNTRIALVYLASIANSEIVREVEDKLKSISTDMVFSPGVLEEFLEDDTLSPFPQMLNTERPDRVMAK